MKKSNRNNKPAKAKRKDATAAVPVQKKRRSFLASASTVASVTILLGGLGLWGARNVQAAMSERDLTGLGEGMPAIVQVHDTQCQTCIALQREVRAALKEIDDGALDYRVADLKSDAGLLFASRYGASHSALLFFDGAGNITQRLVGPNDRATLARAFAVHVSQ